MYLVGNNIIFYCRKEKLVDYNVKGDSNNQPFLSSHTEESAACPVLYCFVPEEAVVG